MSEITNVKITALHVGKSVNFECANLDISQTFKPNWSTERAYGKMDPIANYSGTERTAKFKMILLANQLSVARQLQTKIGKLIQFNYPAYANKGGLSFLTSPPFFEISCLQNKLYTKLKGFITDINIVPGSDQQVVPLVNARGKFFERRYDIDFGFTVLHSHVVGYIDNVFNGGSGEGFVFYGDVKKAPKNIKKSAAALKAEVTATEIENFNQINAMRGADMELGYEQDPDTGSGGVIMEGQEPVQWGVGAGAPVFEESEAATVGEVAAVCGAGPDDSVNSVKNFTAPPVNQSSIEGE